ncbi:hypothetical protein LJY25_06290 [Hymenobacter sp. BT175]|uniref:glycine-rich protein n=1 Tax=Hymenobacter translucens TaxID=2886507 RepID=UPI001D0EAA9F|nr:glycine-rich protein [Hymenobacter translucens]MCC2546047.1 hypothetical protein [Hymenobacter translucens]
MLNRYLLTLLTALLLATASLTAQAQTGGVGVGTTTPNSSAILDVSSTSKGLLPPRLTQTQRDAIASPAAGLTIYNTTTGKLNTWNGTSWDAALSSTEQPYGPAGTTFTYTGSAQTYSVPLGVTSLLVDASGAQGGGAASASGGAGGRVQTTLAVTPGEVLTVYVGGQGSRATASTNPPEGGGYNGGGHGRSFNYGGGGATDLRRGAALVDRLVVAGGGGGAASAAGGAGGGLTGAAGGGTFPGQGGTQSAGGAGGQGVGTGSLGQGGTGNFSGGGGGYYGGGGGGGGSGSNGGGGGGSSFVAAAGSSATTHTPGYRSGNGTVTLTPVPTYAAPVLSGVNFVNVPGTFDNLGNHTATQGLQLNGHVLSNNGTGGVRIDNSGNVGIGTTPAQKLDVDGTVRLGTSTAPGAVLTRTTGAHNMLPVAYGKFSADGLGVTSGNFTFTYTSPGTYVLTFPAASGLSNYNFSSAVANVSIYGGRGVAANAFVSWQGATGIVRLYVTDGVGNLIDRDVSFVVYQP